LNETQLWISVVGTVLLTAACGGTFSFPTQTVQELYVSNSSTNSVMIFAATATGNIARVRTIRGGATALNNLVGLALDGAGNDALAVRGILSRLA
jgi:hypothetical protein